MSKRKREINIAEITQKSRKVDKFDIIAKNQNGILNIGFITAVQFHIVLRYFIKSEIITATIAMPAIPAVILIPL